MFIYYLIQGVISEQQIERKPSISNCPRCSWLMQLTTTIALNVVIHWFHLQLTISIIKKASSSATFLDVEVGSTCADKHANIIGPAITKLCVLMPAGLSLNSLSVP